MMKMRKTTLALAPLAVLALLAPAALAQDDTGVNGDVRVGGGTVTGDKDSSKLQEFETMPNRGFADIDLNFTHPDSPFYIDVAGENLGLKDWSGIITIGQHNGFKLSFFGENNPRWFSNTASTFWTYNGVAPINVGAPYPLNGFEAGQFLIDPSIRNAAAVDVLGHVPLTDFAGAFVPVDLQYWRRTAGGELALPFLDGFNFTARYVDERRRGTRPMSLATYFANGPVILETPSPVQYRSRTGQFGLEYNKKTWFVAANAVLSRFNNDVPFLFVENPNRLTDAIGGFAPPGSPPGAAANWLATMPPDNRAYTVDLSGGVNLPMHHRVTATISTGEMRDDALLDPFLTSNTALWPFLDGGGRTVAAINDETTTHPIDRLDGKIDTRLYMVRLTGQPIPLIGYSLSYRQYKVDNKTPIYTFTNYVPGDTEVDAGTGFSTNPYGSKIDTWKGEVHVAPVEWVRLGVEYRNDKIDHTFREIDQNKTDTWTGFADITVTQRVSAHLRYSDLKKKVSGCESPDCTADGDAPYLRRFDVNGDHAKLYLVQINWTPIDALSVGLTAQQAKHDFDNSGIFDPLEGAVKTFGLTDSKYTEWGASVSYVLAERVSVYGDYTHEKFEWNQASRYRAVVGGVETDNPLDDWYATTNDKTETWAIGAKGDIVPKVFTLSADLTYSKTTSTPDCIPVPGGATSGNCVFASGIGTLFGWPPTETKFTWLKTRAYYTFRKNLSIGGEYWKYKFDGANWQTDVMQNFMGYLDPSTVGAPGGTSVFLGARVPTYDANIFRLYLDYHF